MNKVEHTTDNLMVPEVGKFYKVPTIRLLRLSETIVVPVHGSKHEDKQFIKFPYQHWHADPRFMSDRVLHTYEGPFGALPERYAMGLPVAYPRAWDKTHRPWMAQPLDDEPIYRLRKCQRTMPLFPDGAPWLKKLSKHWADYRLDLDNPVCPHRGFTLCDAPRDADGYAVCPGHGLRWNLETGTVVIP